MGPSWYHSVVLPSLCHRAGTLIRLRDAISTVRSLLLECRLDVEARHAPERMHDEWRPMRGCLSIVRLSWYHSMVLSSLCHRAGTLIRLRDAISTVRSLLLEPSLDVEARHAPERMHDEWRPMRGCLSFVRPSWLRWGSDLPQVWPMRADPMNVVMRHGKGRMTIDKTMELVEGIVAYN